MPTKEVLHGLLTVVEQLTRLGIELVLGENPSIFAAFSSVHFTTNIDKT